MDFKEIRVNISNYTDSIGSVNTRNWIDSTQDRDYWEALVNGA